MQRHRQGMRGMVLGLVFTFLSTRALSEEPKYRFDIDSTDIATAMTKFSDQSSRDHLYLGDDIKNRPPTKPIHGIYTVLEALDAMLAGTGLVSNTQDTIVSIRSAPSTGASASDPKPDLSEANSWSVGFPWLRTLQEVVVTGSNLAITSVDNLTAPLLRLDRSRIESAPYLTVQDTLRTLPIVSRAGASETFSPSGANLGRGSAINLRGIGPQATLLLVDGQRQPFSGYDGNFVDVTNLPASVVERIDVLADGASAIYGADAITGVVNVIMRHDLEGSETRIRYGDGTGGANEIVLSQLWGHHWEHGKALLAYEFSRNDDLPAAERAFAANSDKRSIGGSDHSGLWSSPGNILDPSTLQPIYGMSQTGVLQEQINRSNRFAQTELLPDRRAHKFYSSGSIQLNENWEAFETLRFTSREASQREIPTEQFLYVPASNAYFPTGFNAPFAIVAYRFDKEFGPVTTYSTTDNGAFSAGVKGKFGGSWRGALTISSAYERLRVDATGEVNPETLDSSLENSTPANAFDPFSNGTRTTPETLRQVQLPDQRGVRSRLGSFGLLVNGEAQLPTGAAQVAVGLEHRREEMLRDSAVLAEFSRDVDSLFSELSLPVWQAKRSSGSIHRVELSAAARVEKYSDAGSTTNPRLGLRWVVSDRVRLRGSWGTSFRAPTLFDTHDTAQNATGLAILPDPKSESGSSLVLVHQGANPNLRHETAQSWSAGIDFVSTTDYGFSGSITLWNLRYANRILQPGPTVATDILQYEAQWSQVIQRNPVQSELQAACSSPDLKVPLLSCLESDPSAIIDLRLQNLATTRMRGIDIGVAGALPVQLGRVEYRTDASYVSQYEQGLSRDTALESLVNTIGNTLRLRGRAELEWSQLGHTRPGWGVTLALNRAPSYRDPGSAARSTIASRTTADIGVRFRQGESQGWDIRLNAVNVFDQDPPFVDTDLGFDGANADVYGRTVSLTVGKRW